MDMLIDRRTELLSAIVDALLAHGAADLSLRPLAERVGTSARLLIYHFGSKEQLLADALAEVRYRVQIGLNAYAATVRPTDLRTLVMMVWDWATMPANQSYFRLLFEVDGLSMFDQVDAAREVGRANSAVWIALIERAAGRLPAQGPLFSTHSTLILGTLVGLLQEFLSTGDLGRTTAAMSALIDLIVQNSEGSKS